MVQIPIVGRDEVNPGKDLTGAPFYEPLYLPDEERYEEVSRVTGHTPTASNSVNQMHEDYLNNGKTLPAWVSHRQAFVSGSPSSAALASPQRRWY